MVEKGSLSFERLKNLNNGVVRLLSRNCEYYRYWPPSEKVELTDPSLRYFKTGFQVTAPFQKQMWIIQCVHCVTQSNREPDAKCCRKCTWFCCQVIFRAAFQQVAEWRFAVETANLNLPRVLLWLFKNKLLLSSYLFIWHFHFTQILWTFRVLLFFSAFIWRGGRNLFWVHFLDLKIGLGIRIMIQLFGADY